MFYDPEIGMFDAGMCVADLHESTDPLIPANHGMERRPGKAEVPGSNPGGGPVCSCFLPLMFFIGLFCVIVYPGLVNSVCYGYVVLGLVNS